eukprot:CAMPEP_0172622160 /NCGR_PEP_ID=MMETSP1068-20121228/118442_1 /TAXON_ID=35684 /ORGANISM="Pseudopedinella elastica, Strain CCMP716" /LENGTH=74 /DNA_ID=CAMNT_0013430235 /DNA_START=32 /DNA_END=253 /DNA_ORIENTATION=+
MAVNGELDTPPSKQEPTTKVALHVSPGLKKPQVSMGPILRKAGKRALGGGKSGALAGVIQVLSLMWLRTIMNFQ